MLDVDASLMVMVVLCVVPLVAAVEVKVVTELEEVSFAGTVLDGKGVVSALEVDTETHKYASDILPVEVGIIAETELEPSILARRLS